MQKCKALEDEALPPLVASLPVLGLLNLTDCQLLRSPTIASDRLTTLHLYNCLRLTAPTVACPQLTLLNLTYCVSLERLTLRCARLESLLCAGCKALQEDAVAEALQVQPPASLSPPRTRVTPLSADSRPPPARGRRARCCGRST